MCIVDKTIFRVDNLNLLVDIFFSFYTYDKRIKIKITKKHDFYKKNYLENWYKGKKSTRR